MADLTFGYYDVMTIDARQQKQCIGRVQGFESANMAVYEAFRKDPTLKDAWVVWSEDQDQ